MEHFCTETTLQSDKENFRCNSLVDEIANEFADKFYGLMQMDSPNFCKFVFAYDFTTISHSLPQKTFKSQITTTRS